MAAIGVLTLTLPPSLKSNSQFSKITSVSKEFENIRMISGQMLLGNVAENQNKRKKVKSNSNADHNKQSNQQPPTKKIKLNGSVTKPSSKANVNILNSFPLSNISNTIPNNMSAIQTNKSSIVINNNNNNNGVSGVISGKKSSPLPQAVARRNARERNRVKQVNNGFSALRQRIPEEVAEAFEAAGNGRGNAKKLSKVETLRMAVEYIRSLERILGIEYKIDPSIGDNILSSEDDTMQKDFKNISSNSFDAVIKTEYCTSSPPTSDDRFDDSSLYDPDESSVYFSDGLPDVTTINGQQYLRIPGTNTYQLLTFENEENIEPMISSQIPISSSPSIENFAEHDIEQTDQLVYNLSDRLLLQQMFQQQQQQSNIVNNLAPVSISPDQFSNNSTGMQSSMLSPVSIDHNHQQQNLLSQLQMQQNQLINNNNQQHHNNAQQQFLKVKCEEDEIMQRQQQQHHHHQQFLHHHHSNEQQQQPPSVTSLIKMSFNNQMVPTASQQISQMDSNQADYLLSSNDNIHLYDGGVINLKNKIKIENDGSNDIENDVAGNGDSNNSVVVMNNSDVLAAATHSVAGLSEESMMEAMDWWDPHTPKNEQNSVM